MKDFEIIDLTEETRHLIDAFSCVETDEFLEGFKSADRRRIKKHSKDMEDYLKIEAMDEQNMGLSKTYLLVSDGELIAYFSLCNDAVRLEFEERNELGFPYSTIPAMKIARLAVSTKHQRSGIGKAILQLSVLKALDVREHSGVALITLDCYEHRRSYYKRFGFIENLIQPVQLPYDSPISMRLVIDDYLAKLGI